MALRWSAAILVASLVLPLAPSSAYACSCIQQTSIQAAARADVVFVGRLERIDLPPPAPIMSSLDPVTYHFDVERVLKGAAPVNAKVGSVIGGASCGLEWMYEGDRYTVFATREGTELRANLCGGTHQGDPDPALLVFTGSLLPPEPDRPSSYLLGAVALGGAGLAALLMWRRWRTRSRAASRPV